MRRAGAAAFAAAALGIWICGCLPAGSLVVPDAPARPRPRAWARARADRCRAGGSTGTGRDAAPSPAELSRRGWIGAALLSAATSAATAVAPPPVFAAGADGPVAANLTRPASGGTAAANATTFKAVNLTRVAAENTVNVTSYTYRESRKTAAVYVDREDFTYVTVKRLPGWIPKEWRPRERIEIPNSQLLAAATVAGSVTEAVRTALLHPLATLKARIQASPSAPGAAEAAGSPGGRVRALREDLTRAARQGDLLAGLGTALAITVPASGAYFGVRDVARRMLGAGAGAGAGAASTISPIQAALAAAFVADLASLAIRTPADVYVLRRQVAPANSTTALGREARDALRDSLPLFPAAILTDVPYLLLRLVGNFLVAGGGEDLGTYEVETVLVACLCAALTTPLDVARTRIFVAAGTAGEGPPDPSVLRTMRNVTGEGEGGILNLYAGCLERTAYFGIGRAWFDPIRIIGYLGLRDAVLLQWFLK